MQCPKPDCMYLHELGDEAASFTKEEMQVVKLMWITNLVQKELLLKLKLWVNTKIWVFKKMVLL